MYRRPFLAAPSADTDVQGVKLDAGPDVAANERSAAAHDGYCFVPVTTIPISRLPHLEQLSRARQSMTVVAASYRSACSAGSGSTW
jgi:hypothetical protein